MRKIVFNILKILLGLAAAANLVALFVYQYDFPDSWPRPFGSGASAEEIAAFPVETEAEDTVSSGVHIDVPAAPINYNGAGELVLMDGVYVINADGTAANEIEVETEISDGSSRREKIVTYTAVTRTGEVLTAERPLYLGSRYTGPSISILANLPFCFEGEAEDYAQLLRDQKVISAEDGFGNDLTGDVVSVLKSYDASKEEAMITLSVVNQFGDEFSMDIAVSMNATGVILKLTAGHVNLQEGDSFYITDYVKECHDAEGYSLVDRIEQEGDVDTSVPGEYTLTLYCSDWDGVYSKEQTLTVTVEETPPEPEEEAQEDSGE